MTRISSAALVGLAACILLANHAQIGLSSESDRLQVGQPLPRFVGLEGTGALWRSVDHVGMQVIVVYFSPGDFCGHCNERSRRLRETFDQLVSRGVAVVGVSGDSPANHALFRRTQDIDYVLLSDEDASLASLFGVPYRPGGKARVLNTDGTAYWPDGTRKSLIIRRGVTMEETLFVIGRDGKVLYRSGSDEPVGDGRRLRKFLDGGLKPCS